MSETVIKIEGLSKIYRLGEVGSGTLSHDLNRRCLMNIRGQEDPYAKIGHVNDRTRKAQKGELVTALSDINLEVKPGKYLVITDVNHINLNMFFVAYVVYLESVYKLGVRYRKFAIKACAARKM